MADIPVYESTAETVVVVTANGQTTFAFDFLILFPEQMAVLHGRGDVATVLTYPADFSVSGLDQPNGGTVALNVATLANDVITMRRVTPIERLNDWQNEGDYKAALVNREQDTMFMIMQELARDTGKTDADFRDLEGKAAVFPDVYGGSKMLPLPAPGRSIIGSLNGDGFVSSAFSERQLLDASSSAISAADASVSAANRAISYAAMLSADKVKFKSKGDLVADTLMSYAPGAGRIQVGPTDVIEASGHRFRVVSSAEARVSRHLKTDGGVWLDRLPSDEDAFGFSPLRNISFEPLVDGIYLVASRLRDGYVYGAVSGGLYRSSDGGRSWSGPIVSGLGNIRLLVPAGDGEVLMTTIGGLIQKTIGWGTGSVSKKTVISAPDSDFLSWGLDSNGKGLCVATHYRSTDYTKSRYVWKSTDSGETWTVIFDLDDYHSDVANPQNHHLHLCALDPWANDRIWISWHAEVSVGGGGKAIMYSDDEGATWNTLTTEWQPTTGVATPSGMVFGTDDGPGGILHCERTEDPADMKIYLAAPFPVEQTPFAWVFATYAEYDETTGVAYTAFISQVNGTPAGIFASDGRTASEIYRSEREQNGNGVNEFAFYKDEIIWRVVRREGSTNVPYTMRTPKARRGPSNPSEFDTGRIMGGQVFPMDTLTPTPFRSTAIGVLAEAGPSTDAIAIGYQAKAGHGSTGRPQTLAIGPFAEAGQARAIALGTQAKANNPDAIVIGHGGSSNGTAATILGSNAKADGQGTAIGEKAYARAGSVSVGVEAGPQVEASSVDFVAFGRLAKAGSYGVAVGQGAIAAISGVAVGRLANAGQDGYAFGSEASALPNGVTFGGAAGANEFRVGDNRHLQLSLRTTVPTTPPAGEVCLYLWDNGGTLELRLRVPGGGYFKVDLTSV